MVLVVIVVEATSSARSDAGRGGVVVPGDSGAVESSARLATALSGTCTASGRTCTALPESPCNGIDDRCPDGTSSVVLAMAGVKGSSPGSWEGGATVWCGNACSLNVSLRLRLYTPSNNMLSDVLILPPDGDCCRALPLDCDDVDADDEDVLFDSADDGFALVFSPTRTVHAFVLWYDQFTKRDTALMRGIDQVEFVCVCACVSCRL